MVKTCNLCHKELNINRFQKIVVNGSAYTRNACKSCRGRLDRQVKLKKRFKAGDLDVSKCTCCGKFVQNKARVNRLCIPCRDNNLDFLCFVKKKLINKAEDYKKRGDYFNFKKHIGLSTTVQLKIEKVRKNEKP